MEATTFCSGWIPFRPGQEEDVGRGRRTPAARCNAQQLLYSCTPCIVLYCRAVAAGVCSVGNKGRDGGQGRRI
ncbi:unnamed protein product [Chondrus crispus]|uniref:Uncharacterized protein n=1 Tax=Chondrus crispus TaxID=2769 RepID=R7Q4U2_CHOCR|nr:unnamed protein product [Chondrus crispus]CDF33019.1 unnamed protein product [Chondrus crispus]|eukprot:XP_005712822.1 unnamed protein product [Chondrus crispus]